jgi:hypothetical protein
VIPDRTGRLTVESAAWLTLLALAAWTRFSGLGRLPLSDAEAGEALAAAASSGNPSEIWEAGSSTASPAYHVLTSLLFAPFEPSDGLARAVPALAGVALVATPLLARRSLGRGAALAAGIVLLLSPTALSIARAASGAALASLGWMVAALGLFHRSHQPERGLSWTALGAGLALASGAHAVTGLFALIAGRLLFGLWELRSRLGAPQSAPRRRGASPLGSDPPGALGERLSSAQVLTGALVMLVLATGAGLVPSGLPGLPEGLAGWVRGWTTPNGYGLFSTPLMLGLYEPLAVLFGLAGARLAARLSEPHLRREAAWAAGALLVLLIYPGSSPEDLAWLVLPLAPLAGRAVAALIEELPHVESWPAVGGFGAAAVILVAYAFLQVAGYATGVGLFNVQVDFALQLGLAALGLILAALGLLFLGWGWSWRAALQAAGLAGLLLAAGVTISAAWRLNFTPVAATARELWRREVSTAGVRLLGDSLERVSQAQTGRSDALPVRLISPASPSLAWELRRFRLAPDDAVETAPPLVLTPEGGEPPALAEDYLGQSFTIEESWGWEGLLPPDFLNWLVSRRAPTEAVRWLLLVRSDLAGAGEFVAPPEPAS